jgi:DMSO/TMAO reductase YedYZ molybdopterin-dependent catalytic subunit
MKKNRTDEVLHNGLKLAPFTAAIFILAILSVSCSGNADGQDLPPPVAGNLPEVEATEYDGVELTPIAQQGNNAIEGTQYIDRDTYTLRVYGLVENELELTFDELLDLDRYSEVTYMPCVEGWGFTAKWTGIRVMDILDMAGLKDDAMYALFHSEDGYTTGHEIDFLRDENIIMAYGLNDITLPYDRGFPFQLVARDKYGYKWAKWITEIEILSDVEYGFWEQRGYSETGNVGEPGYVGSNQ